MVEKIWKFEGQIKVSTELQVEKIEKGQYWLDH